MGWIAIIIPSNGEIDVTNMYKKYSELLDALRYNYNGKNLISKKKDTYIDKDTNTVFICKPSFYLDFDEDEEII